jgi:hypothetical protein
MEIGAQLNLPRLRCPWTLQVDFEPQWSAAVEVPDLHPIVYPVPRRTLTRSEKEVDRGAGLVGPGLPVVATLGMGFEGEDLKKSIGVHAMSMFDVVVFGRTEATPAFRTQR